MSAPRVLVTGASGFIGSHLLSHLREHGCEAIAMVRASSRRNKIEEAAKSGPPFELRTAALDEVEAMSEAARGCQWVVHVAGVVSAFDREAFEKGNYDGTVNLLKAIEALAEPERPKRFVLLSSLMAAGPSSEEQAEREHFRPREGLSLYGDSKLRAERGALTRCREMGLELVIIRPPIVYGPRDPATFEMVKSAAMGLIASPTMTRLPYSAVHVYDLCEGIIAAAQKSAGVPLEADASHVLNGQGESGEEAGDALDPRGQGIYFFEDGARHTIAAIGQAAAEACGRRALTLPFPGPLVSVVGWMSEQIGRVRGKVPALTVDKANAARSAWWCDSARARAELGWSPTRDLAQGMREAVDWYRAAGWL